MTREELMKKCYSIAVEMGLGAINEKDFNKIMWTGIATEEIEEWYRFLQEKKNSPDESLKIKTKPP